MIRFKLRKYLKIFFHFIFVAKSKDVLYERSSINEYDCVSGKNVLIF